MVIFWDTSAVVPLLVAESNPRGHRFHTLDGRLTEAARREGFELVDAAQIEPLGRAQGKS